MLSRRKLPEFSFYIIAFALALALRFIQLGALPLTDAEATWALQAWKVAQGARPLVGPNPAYVLLTSLLFYVLGPSNLLARLVPTLVGSALVFVPYLFRERIKARPAALLAVFLAVDPGLTALSRQAGSAILAITFILFAWAYFYNKKQRVGGIFVGLALLSGPAVWVGLLGLGIAWALRQGMTRSPNPDENTKGGLNALRSDLKQFTPAIWYGLGTILLGGTLFFLAPNGLSAWLSSLPDYFKGWYSPSGVPAGRLLFALLAYQPLALILALLSLVRGWTNGLRRVIMLSVWLLVILLLVLFYPARQVTDLGWVIVPLWALAALELARHFEIPAEITREVSGVIVLTLIILTFAWLDLASLVGLPSASADANQRLVVFLATILLLILSLGLVALGWTVKIAKLGGLWGLVVALGVYTLAMAWGATGLRTPQGVELWAPRARIGEADLMLKSVDQLSDWSNGQKDSQSVTIVGLDSPALEWLLRDHHVTTADALDPSSSPPLVITPTGVNTVGITPTGVNTVGITPTGENTGGFTPQVNQPKLASSYRGQDFVWRQIPAWDIVVPSNWIDWLVFHKLPQDSERIILWARNDLFLDAQTPSTTP